MLNIYIYIYIYMFMWDFNSIIYVFSYDTRNIWNVGPAHWLSKTFFEHVKVAMLVRHQTLKKSLGERKILSFHKGFNSWSLCFVHLVLFYKPFQTFMIYFICMVSLYRNDPTLRKIDRWLIFQTIKIRLKIKPNSVRIRSLSWQFFFPRRDLNSHHWYTWAAIAYPYVQRLRQLGHIRYIRIWLH